MLTAVESAVEGCRAARLPRSRFRRCRRLGRPVQPASQPVEAGRDRRPPMVKTTHLFLALRREGEPILE